MSDTLIKILRSMVVGLGILSLGVFLVAEIHAWQVITPKGILCENPDFGVMWHMDSMLPMQFRLMSYRAGGGDFRDLGFLLPATGLLALGISIGMHCLTETVERWNRRLKDPAKPGNNRNPEAATLLNSKTNQKVS